MRLALAQINTKLGYHEDNLEKYLIYIKQATRSTVGTLIIQELQHIYAHLPLQRD